MKKKLIYSILFFLLIIVACRNEETSSDETNRTELISKSLWKEDMVFIKNVKDIFNKNFDRNRFFNDYGKVEWRYAMTFGKFDESFLRVPVIKDNVVISIMQVVRDKELNKVFFSHTEDNESLKFFQNLIFSNRPLKPLKDSSFKNSNLTARAYWNSITTCTTRTLIVGCVYSGATEGDCIAITSTTTTCTTTYIYLNDYSSDQNDGYNPPDGYTYDGTRINLDSIRDATFVEAADQSKKIPENYLDCLISATGSISLTIYVDQPISGERITYTDANGNTGSSIDKESINVGHTFIGLKRGNVNRSFGFYPSDGVKPFSPEVGGSILNDASHPYDVSLTINISSSQLNQIINHVKSYNKNYNLNDNNCSDFGLGIFDILNLPLPDTRGSWPFGGGTNPGDLGEDIRNMTTGNGMSKDTDGGEAPSNSGNC